MKGIIADPIDWVNKKPKNILQATTSKGKITIQVTTTVIIARDSDGKMVAQSFRLDEKGLSYVKTKCRGWYNYDRLNWRILSVS